MTDPIIPDDEIVLRHVPGGPSWQAPPDGRISSFNFRLRPGESGISVSVASVTSPARLVARLGDPQTGSKIGAASVASIRALGLVVEPVPLPEDSGHAEIRSDVADLASKAVQKGLARLFRYVAI